MPQLPSVDQQAYATPTPQRQAQGYNPAPVVGNEGLLKSLAGTVDKLKDDSQKYEYQTAKINLRKHDLDVRRQLDEDPDFLSSPKKYQEQMKTAIPTIGANLSGDYAKQFQIDAEEIGMTGYEDVYGKMNTQLRGQKRGELQENYKFSVNDIAGEKDPAKKAAKIKDLISTIKSGGDNKYLHPEEVGALFAGKLGTDIADAKAILAAPGDIFKYNEGIGKSSNNNPGNIRDKKTGNFMSFNTPEEGAAAMRQDLMAKIIGNSPAMDSHPELGKEPTLSKLINVYAPKGDNNDTSAYIKFITEKTGIKSDQVLTPLDVPKLQAAMTIFEGNGTSTPKAQTPDVEFDYLRKTDPVKWKALVDKDRKDYRGDVLSKGMESDPAQLVTDISAGKYDNLFETEDEKYAAKQKAMDAFNSLDDKINTDRLAKDYKSNKEAFDAYFSGQLTLSKVEEMRQAGLPDEDADFFASEIAKGNKIYPLPAQEKRDDAYIQIQEKGKQLSDAGEKATLSDYADMRRMVMNARDNRLISQEQFKTSMKALIKKNQDRLDQYSNNNWFSSNDPLYDATSAVKEWMGDEKNSLGSDGDNRTALANMYYDVANMAERLPNLDKMKPDEKSQAMSMIAKEAIKNEMRRRAPGIISKDKLPDAVLRPDGKIVPTADGTAKGEKTLASPSGWHIIGIR